MIKAGLANLEKSDSSVRKTSAEFLGNFAEKGDPTVIKTGLANLKSPIPASAGHLLNSYGTSWRKMTPR